MQEDFFHLFLFGIIEIHWLDVKFFFCSIVFAHFLHSFAVSLTFDLHTLQGIDVNGVAAECGVVCDDFVSAGVVGADDVGEGFCGIFGVVVVFAPFANLQPLFDNVIGGNEEVDVFLETLGGGVALEMTAALTLDALASPPDADSFNAL